MLLVNGCMEIRVIMCLAGGGNMTIKQTYDNFIDELMENAMRKQREEDKEFHKCYERLDELTDKVNEYMQICDVEIRGLLLAYEEVKNEEETRHCEFLYEQGIRDCFKLLKFLEIL